MVELTKAGDSASVRVVNMSHDSGTNSRDNISNEYSYNPRYWGAARSDR